MDRDNPFTSAYPRGDMALTKPKPARRPESRNRRPYPHLKLQRRLSNSSDVSSASNQPAIGEESDPEIITTSDMQIQMRHLPLARRSHSCAPSIARMPPPPPCFSIRPHVPFCPRPMSALSRVSTGWSSPIPFQQSVDPCPPSMSSDSTVLAPTPPDPKYFLVDHSLPPRQISGPPQRHQIEYQRSPPKKTVTFEASETEDASSCLSTSTQATTVDSDCFVDCPSSPTISAMKSAMPMRRKSFGGVDNIAPREEFQVSHHTRRLSARDSSKKKQHTVKFLLDDPEEIPAPPSESGSDIDTEPGTGPARSAAEVVTEASSESNSDASSQASISSAIGNAAEIPTELPAEDHSDTSSESLTELPTDSATDTIVETQEKSIEAVPPTPNELLVRAEQEKTLAAELKDAISRLLSIQSEKETLDRERSESQKKVQELEQKNQDLEQENQNLEKENQNLEQETQKLEEENHSLKQETQDLEQETQSLERANQKLEQENEDLNTKVEELENIKASLEWDSQKKAEELEEEIEGLKSRIDEYKNTTATLGREKFEGQKKVEEMARENQDLMTTIGEYENAKVSLQNDLQQRETTIMELQVDLEKAKMSASEEMIKMESLQESKGVFEERCVSLEKQIVTIKEANRELHGLMASQIGDLEITRDALQVRIEALERDVASKTSEMEALSAASDNMCKEVESLNADKAALDQTVQDLQQSVASLEKEKEALVEEKQSLSGTIESLTAEKSELSAMADSLREQNGEKDGEILRLVADRETFAKDLATLQEKTAELEQTTSDSVKARESTETLLAALQGTVAQLEEDNGHLKSDNDSLKSGDLPVYDELRQKHAALEREHGDLQNQHTTIQEELRALRDEHTTLLEEQASWKAARVEAARVPQLEQEVANMVQFRDQNSFLMRQLAAANSQLEELNTSFVASGAEIQALQEQLAKKVRSRHSSPAGSPPTGSSTGGKRKGKKAKDELIIVRSPADRGRFQVMKMSEFYSSRSSSRSSRKTDDDSEGK